MTFQPGRTLAHYRLIEPIGQGGMGVVWRAVDTRLDREVALKLLPEGLFSDAERLARFESEARVLAALSHPNIVTLHAIEEAEDARRFLVMELVRGRTLAELIPETGLPYPRFLELATALADAIRAAHERGIVHRDLKPRNVMIDDEGRLKILDFGLALVSPPAPPLDVTELPTETGPGVAPIAGTPLYMAPEQIRGSPAGAPSDVFALGVVLYEMATGHKPFGGRMAVDAIASVLKDAPTPPSRWRPSLPPRLERLILACLDKEPGRRPASAGPVWRELQALRGEAGAASRAPDRSIAVLPFVDMSPGKDQAYFCEGIAEEILLALARVKGLRVAPRTSSFRMREAGTDARDIGQRLGVATLLDGSVRKAGERLRIAVELVDVEEGSQIFSERYDRELRDVFRVQEEIATSVVGALQVTLTAREQAALRKASGARLESYDYYLRGRQYFYQYNRKGVRFALDLFRHAIEADPGYARAHAGVADCHAFLYLNAGRDAAEVRLAREASQRALELDPELAEAHASHGVALSLSGEPAAAAFEEAIRLDPGLYEAHYFYARDCFTRGELPLAVREYEEASKARPEDYQAPLLVAQIYEALGRESEAAASRRRGVAVAEEHLRLFPDDARALYMGANGLVGLGETARGLEWADRALALDPADPMLLYNIACIKSLAGALDDAIEVLERAVASGLRNRGWIEHDNNLDPIRAHPRVQKLLERLE